MKIILLEKVVNLGALGDVVEVKNGYARNYLIPSLKAKRANEANLKDFEARREEYESAQKDILANAVYRQSKLEAVEVINIVAKASVDGKLFGSVNAIDIVKAVKDTGVEINKNEVLLPNGALKTIGDFEVAINLHHDVQTMIKVNITAQA